MRQVGLEMHMRLEPQPEVLFFILSFQVFLLINNTHHYATHHHDTNTNSDAAHMTGHRTARHHADGLFLDTIG